LLNNYITVEISKGDAKRMIYKNFDDHITRKHGIVIESWPLEAFANPSSIGSQLELKVLLNAWQTGATRFRRMGVDEHMKWVENHAESEGPSPLVTRPLPNPLPLLPLEQHNHQDPAPPTSPPASHEPFSVIQFGLPTTAPTNTNSAGIVPMPKKPRKTRSDKGKSRRKTAQVLGAGIFHTSTL
jgi:hypothetical protein